MIKKNLIARLIFSLGLGFNMNTACADLVGTLETISEKCAFDQLGQVNNICGIGYVGMSCAMPTTNFSNSFVKFISERCVVISGDTHFLDTDGDRVIDTITYCISASALSSCITNAVATFKVYQYMGGESFLLGNLIAAN